jgi:hypothetical protein
MNPEEKACRIGLSDFAVPTTEKVRDPDPNGAHRLAQTVR